MRTLIIGAVAAAVFATAASAQTTTVRWLSQTPTVQTQYPIESAAMARITAAGVDLRVDRQEFMALGLNLGDALRLVRSGTYDIVSTQVGLASRDDAFLEGIDVIGVSTDMDSLEASVNAYRPLFAKRLEERFGARPLAIWPFGPQVFFCNQAIKTVDDLKGQRVRSFTPSMSKLLETLGATPVTISFPEVYPSLQRGVANCGVTSPTSANTGRWPEVTSHLLPLSVSGSVQAHLVNAAWFAKLKPAQRDAVTVELKRMESELWNLARHTNALATDCSIGKGECAPPHASYKMTLVEVAPADLAKVKKISAEQVLPEWADRCERTYKGCKAAWNGSIGKAQGIAIR
ncbi:MAG: ABC transporter substrate-binding protein [Tagaea sp. CACIAM 22H2]|nr:ABC transporter substrate-binding protein [Tagaea sp. CACIAM 22H2]